MPNPLDLRKRNLPSAGSATGTRSLFRAPARREKAIHASAATVVLLALAVAACSTPGTSPGPSSAPSDGAGTSSPQPSGAGPASAPASPAAVDGFAFGAADVLAYYQTLGYTCASPQPSASAPGYTAQSCSLVDASGRTRTVGVVTDPGGRLAAGIASMSGTSSETVLDPSVALEPMSAFVGAMLGAQPGGALVPWLAAHLGDEQARTTTGAITVVTYTDGPGLHAKLYVGLAGAEYLQASGSPAPS